MRTAIQLDIYGAQKVQRIYHRNRANGQFISTAPTELEKLMRENFLLKNKNEELEHKVLALEKYQRILLTKKA